MIPEELLKLFKYFHGEDDCPYQEKSNNAMWWFGEKMIYDQTLTFPDFLEGFQSRLEEAINEGHCSGQLMDQDIPIEKRTIIFYLDLWHGKWFPYDDWSVIETY